MITELRTFIAVIRYGSFASAGENIGLTQGAVSAQMQRLEQQIGVTLFDRAGRRATLTEEGREIYLRAQDIVAAVSQLGKLAPQEGARGAIVVGAITSAQQSWMIDALTVFRQEYPGINIRIVPGASLNILGQVDSGEIDMAVMIRPPYVLPPEVNWHTLMREPFVVLVPEQFKGNDWEDAVQQLPFIRYDRTSFGGRTIDLFLRKRRIHVQEAIELDEIGGLIHAVENGMGAAIIPVSSAHVPFPDSVRVINISPDTPYREIGIAERTQHKQAAVSARLIELLHDSATRNAARAASDLNIQTT